MKSLWAPCKATRVHAKGERVAHDLLDRDDPSLRPDRLMSSAAYVAAFRSGRSCRVTGSRGRPRGSRSSRLGRPSRRRMGDVPGEIVEGVIAETGCSANPATARRV